MIEELENDGLPDSVLDNVCESSNALLEFIGALSEDQEPDWENILAIKSSPQGEIDRVYTPILCLNSQGQLAMRCGNNFFPVNQNGKELTCGSLKGEVEFEKIKNGEKEAPEVSVEWGDYEQKKTFRTVAILSSEAFQDPDNTKAAIKRGEDISPLLRQFGNGNGGNFIRITPLKELSEGSYEIEEIGLVPSSFRFGRYTLLVRDSDGNQMKTMPNTKVARALSTMENAFSVKFPSDEDLHERIQALSDFYSGKFLVISGKESWGQGKVRVHANIYMHAPERTPDAEQTEEQVENTPTPKPEENAQEQQQQEGTEEFIPF
jgi:ribosomal protein S24E